jgi:NtrC-family two-component system response regulator AlgB
LRNVIERAVILCRDTRISAADLSGLTASQDGGLEQDAMVGVGGAVSLHELEAAHIKRVLERCPTMKEAADALGINKATLFRKRKKLNLD